MKHDHAYCRQMTLDRNVFASKAASILGIGNIGVVTLHPKGTVEIETIRATFKQLQDLKKTFGATSFEVSALTRSGAPWLVIRLRAD